MKTIICLGLVVLASACVDPLQGTTTEQNVSLGDLPPPGPTTIHTPVGLALDIEDGVPIPLRVRANQTFYVNQIDMRAHVEATVDEGVARLNRGIVPAVLDHVPHDTPVQRALRWSGRRG